jgi:hypothetical protein
VWTIGKGLSSIPRRLRSPSAKQFVPRLDSTHTYALTPLACKRTLLSSRKRREASYRPCNALPLWTRRSRAGCQLSLDKVSPLYQVPLVGTYAVNAVTTVEACAEVIDRFRSDRSGISSTPECRPAVDETCGTVFRPSAERSVVIMVRASPRISWTRGIRSTPDCARGRKVRERVA